MSVASFKGGDPANGYRAIVPIAVAMFDAACRFKFEPRRCRMGEFARKLYGEDAEPGWHWVDGPDGNVAGWRYCGPQLLLGDDLVVEVKESGTERRSVYLRVVGSDRRIRMGRAEFARKVRRWG